MKIKPGKTKLVTAGKQVYEHLLANPDEVEAQDVVKAVSPDYVTKFVQAVENGRKEWPLKNFYIEVSKKHERQLGSAVAVYHIARSTCPTPNYDQDVYMFNAVKQDDELLWSLPNREKCFDLLARHKKLEPHELETFNYVRSLALGHLYKLAKEMNKEKHGLANPILYVKDNKENL